MNKVIKNSSYFILLWLLLIPSLAFSQGSRYTGSYKKSEPIELVRKKTVIIEGLEFTSSFGRAAITLWDCENIIIRNCKFKDIKTKVAIYAENGTNILVTDCSFENVFGAFLGVASNENIKIEHNDIKNIIGFLHGGTDKSAGIQFNRVSGAGNSISYNSIENIAGESSPEDNISVFASHGTPESPIMVKNNWIRGGGPNLTSGGITTGDYGGSYIIVEDNILVNPGQGGMGSAGGHDITFRNNKIYSKKQPFTNVGFVIANFTPQVTGRSYNITVDNNEINWTHREGFIHNLYYDKSVGVTGLETNLYNKNLDESILPEIIINRAKNSDVDIPDENEPTPPISQITQVYTDRFGRIAIKYYTSPIPRAFGELYTSTGQKIDAMELPRFNTVFPLRLPKGIYYVKITYSDLGTTETNKITVN